MASENVIQFPVDMPRDVSHERALTAAAAAGANTAPSAITDLAERRVLPGPVRDAINRDFNQEALEEGADWRNYICWQIRQLDATGRTDPVARAARAQMLTTLGLVIAAYNAQVSTAALLELDPKDIR